MYADFRQSRKTQTFTKLRVCQFKVKTSGILFDIFHLSIKNILLLDIQHTKSHLFFSTRALNSCLISAGQAVPHHRIFSIHLHFWATTLESVYFNFSTSVWSLVDLTSVRRRRWADLGITGDFCCNTKSANSGGLFS